MALWGVALRGAFWVDFLCCGVFSVVSGFIPSSFSGLFGRFFVLDFMGLGVISFVLGLEGLLLWFSPGHWGYVLSRA